MTFEMLLMHGHGNTNQQREDQRGAVRRQLNELDPRTRVISVRFRHFEFQNPFFVFSILFLFIYFAFILFINFRGDKLVPFGKITILIMHPIFVI